MKSSPVLWLTGVAAGLCLASASGVAAAANLDLNELLASVLKVQVENDASAPVPLAEMVALDPDASAVTVTNTVVTKPSRQPFRATIAGSPYIGGPTAFTNTSSGWATIEQVNGYCELEPVMTLSIGDSGAIATFVLPEHPGAPIVRVGTERVVIHVAPGESVSVSSESNCTASLFGYYE